MVTRTFYLHEDSWGMIDLIPRANQARAGAVAREAEAFGAAHFTGTAWTDLFVLPDVAAAHPLAKQQLTMTALHDLLAARLPPADAVESGYSTYRQALPNAFAFGAGRTGAFYGNQAGGVVEALHFLPCLDDDDTAMFEFLTGALQTLGARYDLILVDWWNDRIIDLRDRDAIGRYLRDDADAASETGGD